MFNKTAVFRTAIVVGAACALAMPAAARSFMGGASAHATNLHHFRFHRGFWPYGYGYGAVATYTPDYSAQAVTVVPLQVPMYVAPSPHCTPSREIITVPAEGGGEKQVTVTRC
ncbi:MAG TPA: hypothetical protein VFA57_04390 [Pseudolabrys sp.]|nr:hypothetical protein [Pseudolabrys sp.]